MWANGGNSTAIDGGWAADRNAGEAGCTDRATERSQTAGSCNGETVCVGRGTVQGTHKMDRTSTGDERGQATVAEGDSTCVGLVARRRDSTAVQRCGATDAEECKRIAIANGTAEQSCATR